MYETLVRQKQINRTADHCLSTVYFVDMCMVNFDGIILLLEITYPPLFISENYFPIICFVRVYQ